jgi:hypothetical protein
LASTLRSSEFLFIHASIVKWIALAMSHSFILQAGTHNGCPSERYRIVIGFHLDTSVSNQQTSKNRLLSLLTEKLVERIWSD